MALGYIVRCYDSMITVRALATSATNSFAIRTGEVRPQAVMRKKKNVGGRRTMIGVV